MQLAWSDRTRAHMGRTGVEPSTVPWSPCHMLHVIDSLKHSHFAERNQKTQCNLPRQTFDF